MEPQKIAQFTMAGAFLVGMGFIIVWMIMHTSSTDARLDALNAMCGSYGHTPGGKADDVWEGNGSFVVICKTEFNQYVGIQGKQQFDAINNLTGNASVWVNFSG